MGHLINPIRLRIGYSAYWQNNWPIFEKNRSLYYFGFHQQLDQYFQTLFQTLQTPVYINNSSVKEPMYGKMRFPHLIYSHLNLNILGFNSDTAVADINIFDFFIDEYLTTFFSPLNTDIRIIQFIKQLKDFFKLDYYLKHIKIVKNITKKTFEAVIKKRRQIFLVVQKVLVNKIREFFGTYSEFIKRTLFSYIRDEKIIVDKQLLFEDEFFHICSMPFKVRKSLLEEYWKKKYSNINKTSLLNFFEYFTGVFHNETVSRKEQKLVKLQAMRAKSFINKTNALIKDKETEKDIKENLLRDLIREELSLIHIQYRNYIIDRQNLLLNIFGARLTREFIQNETLKKKQDSELDYFFAQHKKAYSPYKGRFFKRSLENEIDRSIKKIKRLFYRNSFFQKNYSALNKKKAFINIYSKIFNPFSLITNIINIRNKDILSLNNNELNNYLQHLKKEFDIGDTYSNEFNEINQKIRQLAFLNLNGASSIIEKDEIINFIQNKIKGFIQDKINGITEKYLSYSIDPFYQKFLSLKNLKNLVLNVNVGMGNGRFHISARFLAMYIKRLCTKQNPLWYVQRALRRTLYHLNYLTGYLIIFSGRFTRSLYATHTIQRKGIMSYGNISKIIDYDTIGFTSKFGYCGIKVFLQYKNEWEVLKQEKFNKTSAQQRKNLIPITNVNNNKVNISPEFLNKNSKKIKRVLNSYFTIPNIPHYGQN